MASVKVMVTGASGFLGSAISRAVRAHCHRLVLCAAPDDLSAKLNSDRRFTRRLPHPHFEDLIAQERPDWLIHCAGSASVRASFQDPVADHANNVGVAESVYHALTEHSPETRVINLSSAAVYGQPQTLPITSETTVAPLSPYGKHKLECEQLAGRYADANGIRSIHLRIFSCYGPGLRKQVLWDIYKKALAGKTVRLFGDGGETRDFIFSRDVAKLVIRLIGGPELFSDNRCRHVNVASGQSVEIRQLAETFLDALGVARQLQFTGETAIGDPRHWAVDVEPLSQLGLPEVTSLEKGLASYARWIRSLTGNADADRIWLLQDSIRQWAGWVAGLHYVRNCLEGMATLADEEVPQIVTFVPESLRDRFLDEAGFRDASWLEIKWVPDALLADLSRIEELEAQVAAENCDMLFPAISPPGVSTAGKCLGWITDLQHKHYPEFFSDAELRYRDNLFSFLTATSTRIVCSSQTVRDDIEEHYPQVEDRCFVLRFRTPPPPSALTTPPTQVLNDLGLDQPFAYLPYQFWKHKNHRVVFEALDHLKQRGLRYTLVCSGATVDSRDPEHFPALERLLQSKGLQDQVRILGMVPREQQWQLYRGAKMILQPSLFEGWSTSVEESRALGKHVLLSDTSLHREQMDGIGTFFDPHDPIALADCLEERWNQLPAGYDESSEAEGLAANRTHQIEFGRSLVQLFSEADQDRRLAIAPSVLPLLLSVQNEADRRLQVIEQLQNKQSSSKGRFRKLFGK